MKKAIAIVLSATAILVASCGRLSNMSKVTLEDPLPYKQLAMDNIAKGNETAINTIKELTGKEISATEEVSYGSRLESFTISVSVEGESDESKEYFTCYSVPDYAETPDQIVFCFANDSKAVTATKDYEVPFATEDHMDFAWKLDEEHNEKNYYDSVFAYRDNSGANVIVPYESAGLLTSVWAIKDNSASLLWAEKECPIWSA